MLLEKTSSKQPPPREDLPRLLIIDKPKMGNATATGELKSALFDWWPSDKLMQIYEGDDGRSRLMLDNDSTALPAEVTAFSPALNDILRVFKPELILYRPAPRLGFSVFEKLKSRILQRFGGSFRADGFHNFAMALIERLNLPLVTWVMDDWPDALERSDPVAFAGFDADWRALLKQSRARLSISDAMSEAFEKRYDCSFKAIANGVDPSQWPEASLRTQSGPIKIRYAGSLAENMTRATVRRVAEAVEKLTEEGVDAVFQIKTRELWGQLAAPSFSEFKHAELIVADLSPEDYRGWLANSDIVLIAYNFDEESRSYVKYSLANKLPECLACGAALFAVGPTDVATIKALDRLDCGLRVTQDNPDDVLSALKDLARSPERRFALAKHAQQKAFDKFNIEDARIALAEALMRAANPLAEDLAEEYAREDGATVDETQVVSRIVSDRRGAGKIMVDVGAHYGVSANYFAALDWTIYCFEPDPSNRKHLVERFGGARNVKIDSRAVSDKPAKNVSFFSSEESTGISGLHAFRETHTESGQVDVTTVADIIKEHALSHIDFLKIDVEGFDFPVLKGVPWGECSPDVIECEYEDAKTVSLGHSWDNIADYLTARGYAVYVSEWHPIIRYGVPHDWRRIVKYPGADILSNSWGNLLAFKKDPGVNAVKAAFAASMKFRNQSGAQAMAAGNAQQGGNSAAYAGIAKIMHDRSPHLYRAFRILKSVADHVWLRRKWAALCLFLLVVAALVGFLPFMAGLKYAYWALLAAGVVALGGLYLVYRLYVIVRLVSAANENLAMSLAADRARFSKALAEAEKERKELQQQLSKLEADRNVGGGIFRSELKEARAEFEKKDRG